MLNLIALTLLLTSFTLWLSSGNSVMFPIKADDTEAIEKRDRLERRDMKLSVYVTVACFVFTLFFIKDTGWSSIWGLVAAIASSWYLVYLYQCKKKGISPLDKRIVKNEFYNFLLTDVPFIYLYVFTWVQLVIIAFTYGL
jgi:hypothetical protein